MGWLPEGFVTPARVELASGHHLRPIRAQDAEIDYRAVMGSRDSLWARYGAAWGWPPATMTLEQDRADLDRHAAEIAAHATFNFAVLDAAESELLGCVYVEPPYAVHPPGTDAVLSWWVVDSERGGPLEAALTAFLPVWLDEVWGLHAVHRWP